MEDRFLWGLDKWRERLGEEKGTLGERERNEFGLRKIFRVNAREVLSFLIYMPIELPGTK